jgi:GTP-dependent phosphoenolpyruvate carboxykinase
MESQGPIDRLYAFNAEKDFTALRLAQNANRTNALARLSANDYQFVATPPTKTVWWESCVKSAQRHTDWKGKVWNAPESEGRIRIRALRRRREMPVISSEFDALTACPFDAIISADERRQNGRSVYQGEKSCNNGVFIDSTMASERGGRRRRKVVVVRVTPMAMLPSAKHNMHDLFQHWLNADRKLGDKSPKILTSIG